MFPFSADRCPAERAVFPFSAVRCLVGRSGSVLGLRGASVHQLHRSLSDCPRRETTDARHSTGNGGSEDCREERRTVGGTEDCGEDGDEDCREDGDEDCREDG